MQINREEDEIVSNPILVIMAAGLGSRYGGLKQLDALGPNGETLLAYALYDAAQAGFKKTLFIIRREFEAAFIEKIKPVTPSGMEIGFAYQELSDLPDEFQPPADRIKPWGTAHALFCARALIDAPFAVQNADDFYGASAYKALYKALLELNPHESCMVGYRLEHTLSEHGSVSRGICEIEEDQLVRVTEHTEIRRDSKTRDIFSATYQQRLAPDLRCSMNFWGFHPQFMKYLEKQCSEFLQAQGDELSAEWYIPSVVSRLIDDHEITTRIISCESHWFGVTYPADKEPVRQALAALHQQGDYPPTLGE
jgi:NDP-sugar pyrophosphorylase family protein